MELIKKEQDIKDIIELAIEFNERQQNIIQHLELEIQQ